ncbi:MAG: acetyl-CoA carboxylase carboxyltransferase subunit alpha [Alphaproteobacteria bacterium]|nr:acetyl-CoA carboxylase carboxyltransferase subunit alpha [Beijerinckiaceae bacterium]NBQ38612.1 acetyl-CoA carboxylase carboxyltransferase subunit alpha [Alphaproteobacteria bacterium]
MRSYLDFEKSVAEIDAKADELSAILAAGGSPAIAEEIARIEAKAKTTLKELYASLTPWQKAMVARHPMRPHFRDYITGLISDFSPLAGDRAFGEDEAIVAGIGQFRGMSVAVIGQEKGWDTESRIRHNFGMAMPEGYRKAVRVMELADRFNLPVISIVDTAGAYPGIGAEERGQAEAIARSTEACLALGVPNVSIVIGEGGSGGAVAIASTNTVLMLEHSIYTVASPEASASILWRDSSKAQEAATTMKITAQDLLKFGIVDGIIPEPVGGAHRDHALTLASVGETIEKSLKALSGLTPNQLRDKRAEKFLAIGRKL